MTGFVLVDKPVGPTSHDVVDAIRRALGLRRVGHAGTLDPPASGLLVCGVGAATRLLSWVQRLPKTYEARAVLGVRTSTLDATGAVLSSREPRVTEEDVRAAMRAFEGTIVQRPPAVSAVKVGGERAYRRAARGEDVSPAPREVTIHELELTSFAPPEVSLRVTCSSGTYVRSLVADIGERLECGAHVRALRRTTVGPLRVEDAVPPGAVSPADVRPVERVLGDLPVVRADADAARRARSGQLLRMDAADGEVLLLGPGDGPVGVFESKAGVLRPLVVIPDG